MALRCTGCQHFIKVPRPRSPGSSVKMKGQDRILELFALRITLSATSLVTSKLYKLQSTCNSISKIDCGIHSFYSSSFPLSLSSLLCEEPCSLVLDLHMNACPTDFHQARPTDGLSPGKDQYTMGKCRTLLSSHSLQALSSLIILLIFWQVLVLLCQACMQHL